MIRFTLPTDSNERKGYPLAGGCRDYFPAALAGVARWSKKNNEKHNPGQPMHWSRAKSSDHEECIERHSTDLADVLAALDRFKADTASDYQTGRAKLIQAALDEYDARCWRSLAASQEFREKHGLAPLAPGARLPSFLAVHISPENQEILKTGFDELIPIDRRYLGPVAFAQAQGATQKPVDAIEPVIEERRVEAMRRRLIDTELSVDCRGGIDCNPRG